MGGDQGSPRHHRADQSPFPQIIGKGPWQDDQVVDRAEEKAEQNAQEVAKRLGLELCTVPSIQVVGNFIQATGHFGGQGLPRKIQGHLKVRSVGQEEGMQHVGAAFHIIMVCCGEAPILR